MKKQVVNDILVTLFLVCGLLSYWLWFVVKDVEFYQCIAITCAIASLALFLNVKGWAKRMAFTAFFSCLSTVIDEFYPGWFCKLFDIKDYGNMIFTLNDYIFTFLSFFITFMPHINDRFKR